MYREPSHVLLFSQLASPIVQEREAAAREIGELICDDEHHDVVLNECMSWLASQRTESRSSEALLPLIWAFALKGASILPPLEEVVKVIALPSVLSQRLIELIYGQKPKWPYSIMYDADAPVERIDTERFFRVLGRAPGFMRNPAAPSKFSAFKDGIVREFAVVDRRLNRPSLDKLTYGQTSTEWIPNFETNALEALYSGFQRATAQQFDEVDAVEDYAVYTSPVAPSIWLGYRSTDSLHDVLAATSVGDVARACRTLQDSGIFPGRINTRIRHSDTQFIDLQIVGFYQRVSGPGIPDASEVIEAAEEQQRLKIAWDQFRTSIDEANRSEWTALLKGWTVLPSTIRIAPSWPCRWQADFILRDPSIPFCLHAIKPRVSQDRSGVEFFYEDDEHVGSLFQWIADREVARPNGINGPIGVACLLSNAHVNRTADRLRSVPAIAIKRTIHRSAYRYDKFETVDEFEMIGTTVFEIP